MSKREFYTGVGSRKTPKSILKEMTDLARTLDPFYRLRSGHADGADIAFEKGARRPEIWLPYPNFNGSNAEYFPCSEASYIARQYVPKWTSLSQAVQLLFSRNVHQVLGADLKTPSKFLVCWTPDGKEVGGTRIALFVARDKGVPIRNLFNVDPGDIVAEFVKTGRDG